MELWNAVKTTVFLKYLDATVCIIVLKQLGLYWEHACILASTHIIPHTLKWTDILLATTVLSMTKYVILFLVAMLNKLQSYREGRFCGKCQPNYGLAVYSNHLSSCLPCSENKHISWLKYIAIALGPLTVFYFIVALFAAGKMNGLIFSVQI